MSSTRAPPGGPAFSALAGWYREPALGLAPAFGVFEKDDFSNDLGTSGSRYGDLGWTKLNIGSSGGAVSDIASIDATEYGIIRLTTQAQANRGAAINRGTNLSLYFPPIGMVWAVKIRMAQTVFCEFWSGWASTRNGRVRTSNTTKFVGIRYDSAGAGTWEGVAKINNGAGNESTVNLGTTIAATWLMAGFEVVDTGAGVPGIQFFTLNASERQLMVRADIGDPITAPAPTGLLPIALAVYSTGATAKLADIDIWSVGGRIARGV